MGSAITGMHYMAAVCFESTNQAVLEQVLSTDHSRLGCHWHGHFSYSGSGTTGRLCGATLEVPKLPVSQRTGYPD